MKKPKFLSEFSQAKFQMTHCKSRKLNNAKGKTCKPVENMDQDVKIDTTAIPNKRKLILKRTELPLSGKSVTDVKKGVTNKYQYWINYPKCITNNVYRVVQRDPKTHHFNCDNAS